jgi:glycosyltransferase involved in cell wall biosynthesis
MSPKISVVIPTYKRPDLLGKCLTALAEQSFGRSDYEVIVVSDGYDAVTEEAVKRLQASSTVIRYYHLPQKKGPAAARNMGWQKAKGTLIAFTDDDTIPDKDWLLGYWNTYNGEEEVAFTGKVKVPLPPEPTDYEKNTAGLENASLVTANCCCTKAALEKTGGFDEEFSMAWREDSDLEFKLISHCIPIHYKVDALVVHPPRKAPWGVSIKEQKKNMFNALLYKKYPDLYRLKIQRSPRWDYYVVALSPVVVLAGLSVHLVWLGVIAFACWLVLTARFILQRLDTTSKRTSHVLEMIATSVVIPFAAVYWRLYGAWRYKVFFL